MPNNFEIFLDWVDQCKFPEYDFRLSISSRGEYFLQATYMDKDIETGLVEKQFTRKWYLSPYMVKSEVVATCFKCVITSMEHRTREHFTYRGKRIYGPHFDVDALHSIADQTESRQGV